MTGERPSGLATRAFDVALILHADHELNASTFAARVIAATLSDLHSAIVGGIGALKGPLHGGANAEVMKLLLDIGKDAPVEKAEEAVQSSRLEWVIVRPPGLVHSPASGDYVAGPRARVNPAASLSHADAADCLVRALTETTWTRQFVNVGH